jgi:hypothetical protein
VAFLSESWAFVPHIVPSFFSSEIDIRWPCSLLRYQPETFTQVLFILYVLAGTWAVSRNPVSCCKTVPSTLDTVEVRSSSLLVATILFFSLAVVTSILMQHVPYRGRHAMRYFGLLSPRSKAQLWAAIFVLLNQQQRAHPRRSSWRWVLLKTFGTDPLKDSLGRQMHRVGRRVAGQDESRSPKAAREASSEWTSIRSEFGNPTFVVSGTHRYSPPTIWPWGQYASRTFRAFSLEDDHPDSATYSGNNDFQLKLPSRSLTWHTEWIIRSDKTNFYYRFKRRLSENGKIVREKEWKNVMPRDLQ